MYLVVKGGLRASWLSRLVCDELVRTVACYSQADHHRRSQVLKAKAIVNNNTKHNSFVLAQGTLSKFFARAKLSDVAIL